MLPADERLEAEDLAVDLRLRLVVQQQLVVLDRGAQIVLQRDSARAGGDPCRDRRNADHAAALALAR